MLASIVTTPVEYEELSQMTDLRFPSLELPGWYRNVIGVTTLTFLLALAIGSFYYGWWWALAMIGVAIILRSVDSYFDPKFRQEIPRETVREFIYRLTACNFTGIWPQEYNEAEVYKIVESILVSKTGVSADKIYPNARIRADLRIE